MLELKQVVSALLGAIVALLGQSVAARAQRSRAAKRLAQASWEELSAAHFYGPEDKPTFAGFSSQTFDTLFRELAELPETLARDLMRYHWRMKYMEEMKPHTGDHVNPQFWRDARDLRASLLPRLETYAARHGLSLFFRARELPLPAPVRPALGRHS